MKMLKGNTFLYFGDKNVSKVSGIWKALHISIYIAIAINAFVTSMAAGNMFQTFKYNCILFCTEIAFEKEIVPIETVQIHTSTLLDVPTKGEESSNQNSTLYDDFLDTDYDNITDSLSNGTLISMNNSVILDKTGKDVDITKKENKTIIFKNQTHIFENEDDSIAITYAKVDVRKSIFPSNSWCNFVLGIALVTFIFATFCAVLLAMCSKGGKGINNTLNRPQNMVYPILVSSIILGVLNFIASIVVKNGMQGFCSSFEVFTGYKSCSSSINKFTIHERQNNFYFPYLVLSHTFNLTVILFVTQVVVTFLRIIYAVDFQLYALELQENEEEQHFEVEDGQIVRERRM